MIKLYKLTNEGKIMKSISIVLGLIFIAVIGISVCACNPVDADESIQIKGLITFDNSPLSNVEILINNKPFSSPKFSDEKGCFFIEKANKDDIISFRLEGFLFNSYRVSVTNENVIIIATKPKATINLNYDTSMGVIEKDDAIDLNNCLIGDKVTLTATPHTNYKFVGFYNEKTLLCAENKYTFIVEQSIIINAVFEKIGYEFFIKDVPKGAIVIGEGNYSVDENITIEAKNSNEYVFLSWTVNGVEIADKVYNFVFSGNDNVSANFIKRLDKPVLHLSSNSLFWDSIDDAISYDVYLNNTFLCNTFYNYINIYDYVNLSGNVQFAIVAVHYNCLANSYKSEISVDYKKPIDTPTSFGFLFEGDKVFVCFNKINGAINYNIYINNYAYKVFDLPFEQSINTIKVNISQFLTDSINYKMYLTACGTDESESMPTDMIFYNNRVKTSPPEVELNGDIISWSHSDTYAKFSLIINQVKISLDNYTSFNLSEIVDYGTYEIIIEVEVEGFKENSVKIKYTKENQKE